MRWRDFSGEKEFRGTGWERRSRRRWRVVAWKVEGLLRFVIRRVLEGGEGVVSGGREERSSDSGVCVPLEAGIDGVEEVEAGGELDVMSGGFVIKDIVVDIVGIAAKTQSLVGTNMVGSGEVHGFAAAI